VIRPGRILEVSLLGLTLLLLSIWIGGRVAFDPVWGPAFTLRDTTLAWLLIGYGFVAAVLPVWLLLAPRDYLSTFLKIGTVVLLAVAILIARPDLQMPALTRFIDGSGPVFAGQLSRSVHHHARGGLGLTRWCLRNDTEDDRRQRHIDRIRRLLMEAFIADGAHRRLRAAGCFMMNAAGADRHPSSQPPRRSRAGAS
jgi:hypothetical protein